MVDGANFWIAWAVYAVAACVYFVVFWRLTRFRDKRVLRYCLRALMLAIIATPWYVSDDGAAMAPALIIVMMDAITISGEAAARAMVPLFLAIVMSQVVVLLMLLIRRKGRQSKAS
jgi:hypothetical protein